MINKSIKKAKEEAAIFEYVKNKSITQRKAAEILNLSLRQIKRKFKIYLKLGTNGLVHRNHGRSSNRSICQDLKTKIINFLLDLKNKLGLFSPTFATEKILKNKDLTVSRETVRKIMIENNLWKNRIKKVQRHYWRERKHCMGQMIQLDGSKHLWFNNKYSTLLMFIDDATSAIMHAEFVNEETTESLSKATIRYLKKHGRPISIYVDRGKVFKVNNGKKRGITEYHRMLKESDIELKFAYSPQAKGRVERSFITLQDRLVKELKLINAENSEQANRFLENYIDDYNMKFAKMPTDSIDLHRSIADYDLNYIFCIKRKSILRSDSTVNYKYRWFLLLKNQEILLKTNDQIDVLIDFDGTITLFARGKRLNFKEINKELEAKSYVKERIVKDFSYKPQLSHPWRNYGEHGRYCKLDLSKR